ncbi:MAG: DNA polymerase Y family protein [Phenylobacterium sp.]|uniref:Y-family DNA polymerase n=1 Tax=Phenylobacterium sp. TaxID=1871053 RepID=UPI0027199A25|nr:DNA polymerase Y family protein [Phenylobacterium sp.]MDO8900385.1 DNA polymerase Y family protein [Phenylobacterium sp.]
MDNWRRRNPPPAPQAPPSPSPPGGKGRRAGAAPEAPLALVETSRGTRRLAAVDRAARALGLFPGQKAADALAYVPDLVTAEAEPEADAQALGALVDWCVRFSPAVAPDPPDGLFLDVTGLAHLWGGEAALTADFRRRLARNGLPVVCGVADTPGAAWALARHGDGAGLCPPGRQGQVLDPLPPSALRISEAACAQLERLGLRKVSEVRRLPRSQLAQRFGLELITRLDQALGEAPEALAFRRPPNPWFDRLILAEPISTPEDLARVCGDIVERLCARLSAEGQGARRFELAYHRVDGRPQTVEVGLAVGAREAARITRLFLPRLDQVDPGFGVEQVTLAAFEVEALSARQAALAPEPVGQSAVEIAPLVDRLANRLGAERVWTSQAVESHVPERAVARRAPFSPEPPARWDPARPRPIRLFRRPEPIEATAPVPDDPPVQFRWRGQLHRVRLAEGPERIAEEWWKAPIEAASTTHVRDYYRVEDQAGARFWIFRAGLYEAGAPARWWLHGLFG